MTTALTALAAHRLTVAARSAGLTGSAAARAIATRSQHNGSLAGRRESARTAATAGNHETVGCAAFR